MSNSGGGGSRDVTAYVVAPSAARGDFTGNDQVNPGYKGGHFLFRSVAGAGSTAAFPTWKIQGRVVGTTNYFTLATVTPTTLSTQQRWVALYPGLSTSGNGADADFIVNNTLPHIWRITSTNASTGTPTWLCSVHLVD